jgi:uncharacterized membrane protein
MFLHAMIYLHILLVIIYDPYYTSMLICTIVCFIVFYIFHKRIISKEWLDFLKLERLVLKNKIFWKMKKKDKFNTK